MGRPLLDMSREAAEIPPDLQAETERLLNGRTRDIKLSGELLQLYRQKSWYQRGKIARTWAVWIILISFLVVLVTAIFAPAALVLAASMVAGVIPLLNVGLFFIWRRPRKAWIEGLATVLVLMGMFAAYGVVGVGPGGAHAERYLVAGMFVNIVAIMLLGIEPIWQLAIGCFTPILFLAFQLFNPDVDARDAVASALFFGIGIISVVASRQNATLLAHKSFLMSLRDAYRSAALTEANRQLEMLATRDPLTGLANRRSAAEQIKKIWRDRTIPKTGVAFVMADIDHFKKLNDTAGHAAGDDCLTRVARSIEASVRAGRDIVCRHGGEEFLIILNGVTGDMAFLLAERIRGGVEALAIVNPGLDRTTGSAGVVTISVGVAFALDDDAEPDFVIKAADDALYDAKRFGRNRVFITLADDDASPVKAAPRPSDKGSHGSQKPAGQLI